MTTLPTKTKPACRETEFRWLGSDGQQYRPEAMETRHLFMTLVLVWNNVAPPELRILQSGRWNHHLRRLNSLLYTRPYLKRAVRAIYAELRLRQDLEPAWLDTLDRMEEAYNEAIE